MGENYDKTLAQLREQYTEEQLSNQEGDSQLRYQLFAPFFRNLFENKVVYYERGVCIARLEDIEITSGGFHATAHPQLQMYPDISEGSYFPESWQFGGPWASMCLSDDHFFMPYAGWSVWPEAERVQMAEALVLQGRINEALRITKREFEFS